MWDGVTKYFYKFRQVDIDNMFGAKQDNQQLVSFLTSITRPLAPKYFESVTDADQSVQSQNAPTTADQPTPLQNISDSMVPSIPSPLKPNLDYVLRTPRDTQTLFKGAEQGDKQYVVVVAGESGSGKSVFSCLQARESGYDVLYAALRNEKFEYDPGRFPLMRTFLLCAIRYIESVFPKYREAKENLYREKKKYNTSRNAAAQALFRKVLEATFESPNGAEYCGWFEGRWRDKNIPRKVAIVMDEVTNVDLAEGLVESAPELTSSYEHLATDRLLIVISGTGLDCIQYEGRVGTNPAFSRLVTLGSPDVECISRMRNLDTAIRVALDNGTFSRVLKTNTRMFFHAVLPILSMDIHKLDGKEYSEKELLVRRTQRLIEIGSFKELMDYGPRLYIGSNWIGLIEASKKTELLEEAFVYHLSSAILSATERTKKASDTEEGDTSEILDSFHREVQRMEAYRRLDTTLIFSKGLVRKSDTTPALKYLSCFGLTCALRPGFGDEFEEIVALPLFRLFQVQGYTPTRRHLKFAWPPASAKKDNEIGEDEINDLKSKIEKQQGTELADIFEDPVSEVGNGCIILQQGTATAQGADVFALYWTDDKACLECFQCKHKTYVEAVLKSAWSSLGISSAGSQVSRTGSTGYSLTGLNGLVDVLGDRLNKEVRLTKRIVAFSSKTPPRAQVKVATTDGAGVWFREMLEPTISTIGDVL